MSFFHSYKCFLSNEHFPMVFISFFSICFVSIAFCSNKNFYTSFFLRIIFVVIIVYIFFVAIILILTLKLESYVS